MIFVDGRPFPIPVSESPTGGKETLLALLEHPSLVAASDGLKATAEKKVSCDRSDAGRSAPPAKHVYVFQREYATVDPRLVQEVIPSGKKWLECIGTTFMEHFPIHHFRLSSHSFSLQKLAGTDEATTCVGIVIRNLASGMTSIAHLDSPKVVDSGLTQMLSSFVHSEADVLLVHLIGGFEDSPYNESTETETDEEIGYSLSLCSKIVEALNTRKEHFHIKTLCVLGHNTKRDSSGNACPIISGFLVDTSSGSVMPASFDRSSRCPDEIVRRVRVTVSSGDPCWKGKLLETYDTHNDRFQITPCSWTSDWRQFAFKLQQLSDSEFLFQCSTSPLAEGPDFVENERRVFNYLINHPDWRQTFLKRRPRIFERTSDGGWIRFN